MDRETLKDFILEKNLPVESRLYPDLFKCREAVQMANDDPVTYAKKLKLRKADLELDVQIAALNPGMHEQFEVEAASSISNTSTPNTADVTPPTPLFSGKKKLDNKTIGAQADNRVEGMRRDMIRDGEHGPTTQEEIDDL